MPEEMFGPYRIEKLLGRGGMGEVFRAFDTSRDRMVALKRLHAALSADPDFQARFRRESAITARLNQPHIIPVHDYGEIDGRLYLDMRLVTGRDLAAVLAAEGPLTPHRAVDIVGQIATALDAAHAEGLVHRDIKPGNVLLTEGTDDGAGDFAYVSDFGIAHSAAASTSITATGTTVGSLDYMAPERFTTGHGDHRVDVYALGCLLFEALTARRPFLVEGLPAIINAHLNSAPPRPSQLVDAVPPMLDGVVARAMAKDPAQRFPSAGDLASAARAALAPAVSTPSPDSTWAPDIDQLGDVLAPRAGRPRSKFRSGLVVLSVIAVTLAVAGGTLALNPGDGGGPPDITTEPGRTPGENPFMPPQGDDRPGVSPPSGSGGSFPGSTPGLYGGTRNNAACDRDSMTSYLAANPDKAAAWGEVQGIPASRVPGYVGRLTPTLLRSDTAVTNHGFRNGKATPFQSVLQAGTAVLVDEYGVPRARCYCGNPLTPPRPTAGARYTGTTWTGFSPDAVTRIEPAATPVADFTLVTPATGESFVRPRGTTGTFDRPVAAANPTTEPPVTQPPVAQQPVPQLPVQAPQPRPAPPADPPRPVTTPDDQPPSTTNHTTAHPGAASARDRRHVDLHRRSDGVRERVLHRPGR